MRSLTRLSLFLAFVLPVFAVEATPPYSTVETLWAGYNPRALPVEAEVLKETVEDGLVLRTVKYTSEISDGFKVRIVAYYGFPAGGKNLPAIMHLHGGGQNATLPYVKYWAQRGYATLSINWSGKPIEGNPANGKTDWGPLPYNQNSDDTGSVYNLKPNGRWNSWYHWTIAGRRGLTFLEQQPEVDPQRLGMFGVSMGGRLTWMVAGLESRLQCAASVYGATLMDEPIPGVAGSEYVPVLRNEPLWRPTLDAHAYAPLIKCPFFFISAANDFFGRLDNVDRTMKEVPGDRKWWTLSPHFSHHIAGEEGRALVLWMDRWLKNGPDWPAAPSLVLDLLPRDHVPAARVDPANASEVARVDIYYSTGRIPQARFWRTISAVREKDGWQAKLPLTALDETVVATAKVFYRSGLSLNTPLAKVSPAELQAAQIAATDAPTAVIDDFSHGAVDWFVTEMGPNVLLNDKNLFKVVKTSAGGQAIARDEANLPDWRMFTRKLGDPKWHGPAGAGVQFEVLAEKPNALTIVAIQNYESYPWPTRVFAATVSLAGGDWQHVAVRMEDFKEITKGTGEPLPSWEGINLFGFAGKYNFSGGHMKLPNYPIGTAWSGPAPAIAKLAWLK
jgi:dienelactone hydrolase